MRVAGFEPATYGLTCVIKLQFKLTSKLYYYVALPAELHSQSSRRLGIQIKSLSHKIAASVFNNDYSFSLNQSQINIITKGIQNKRYSLNIKLIYDIQLFVMNLHSIIKTTIKREPTLIRPKQLMSIYQKLL